MNNLEREEFTQRMKALDYEEKQIALKTMSNDMLVAELNRRLSTMSENIYKVMEILSYKDEEIN